MYKTLLRIDEEIAKAIRQEAAEKSISFNVLILTVLSERYDIPIESSSRKPKVFFDSGELNQAILDLLSTQKLTSKEVADSIIKAKKLDGHKDIAEIRKTISSVLSGMNNRGLIKKSGKSGRSNIWTIPEK